jgi:hypothetical protein
MGGAPYERKTSGDSERVMIRIGVAEAPAAAEKVSSLYFDSGRTAHLARRRGQE